jgi:uncharacterized glyoxalase superfamily protein PhnB
MNVSGITPILNVSDMEASFRWFEAVGFRRVFEWRVNPDSPVTFGAVADNEHEIFLCLHAQGGRGDSGAWMSVFVDDVDAVYDACTRAGIDIVSPPEDKPWGVRETHVRHPDGHVLRIGTGG